MHIDNVLMSTALVSTILFTLAGIGVARKFLPDEQPDQQPNKYVLLGGIFIAMFGLELYVALTARGITDEMIVMALIQACFVGWISGSLYVLSRVGQRHSWTVHKNDRMFNLISVAPACAGFVAVIGFVVWLNV